MGGHIKMLLAKMIVGSVCIVAQIPTRMFLKTIQQVDFDPFDQRLQRRNNWLALSLWLAKVKRTF